MQRVYPVLRFLCLGQLMVVLLVCNVPCAAQKVDSLQRVLAQSLEDTTRINTMVELSREQYRAGDFRNSLHTAQQARQHATAIGYNKGLGSAWVVSGYAYIRKSDYDSALIHLNKGKDVFTTIGYREGEAKTHHFIGQAYEYQSDYDRSILHYQTALDIFKLLQDREGQATVLNSIGVTYYLRGSYEIALDYYFRALTLTEQLTTKRLQGSIWNNMGVAYQELHQPDKALYYYERHLEHMEKNGSRTSLAWAQMNVGGILVLLKRFEEATNYLDKALAVQEEVHDRRGLIFTLCFYADLYRGEKKWSLAEASYKRALKLAEEIGDKDAAMNPLSGLSKLYISQHRFAEADAHLTQTWHVALSLGAKGWLVKSHLLRSQLDSARGNFQSAYQHYKQYSILQDSLFDQRKSQQIAMVSGLYESEKKDKAIKLLSEEKRHEMLQRSWQQKVFIVAGIVFILIVTGMVFWLRSKIRTEQLLTEQKEEISRTNEEMKTLLEKIENQNQQLAAKNESLEDLHREKDGMIGIVAHDLRSPLSKVSGLANVIELGPLNDEQKEMVSRMRKVCEDGNALIRDLLEVHKIEDAETAIHFKKVHIRDFAQEWLRNYATTLKQKDITVRSHFELHGEEYIWADPYSLIRILDNLFTNAVKFSPVGKTITLTFGSSRGGVEIVLKDEGPGFHPDDLPHLFKKFKKLSARPTAGESSTGLGLSIVHTLVAKNGGTIEVQSVWGQGASFILRFPLHAKTAIHA